MKNNNKKSLYYINFFDELRLILKSGKRNLKETQKKLDEMWSVNKTLKEYKHCSPFQEKIIKHEYSKEIILIRNSLIELSKDNIIIKLFKKIFKFYEKNVPCDIKFLELLNILCEDNHVINIISTLISTVDYNQDLNEDSKLYYYNICKHQLIPLFCSYLKQTILHSIYIDNPIGIEQEEIIEDELLESWIHQISLNYYDLLLDNNIIKETVEQIYDKIGEHKTKILVTFNKEVSTHYYLGNHLPRIVKPEKLDKNNINKVFSFDKKRGRHKQIVNEEFINLMNSIQEKPYYINTKVLDYIRKIDLEKTQTNLKYITNDDLDNTLLKICYLKDSIIHYKDKDIMTYKLVKKELWGYTNNKNMKSADYKKKKEEIDTFLCELTGIDENFPITKINIYKNSLKYRNYKIINQLFKDYLEIAEIMQEFKHKEFL